MSKKFIFSTRLLPFFTLIILCASLMIACADDQDATTTTPDSPGVRSDDSKAGSDASLARPRTEEPRDMHDSTVTLIALLPADANRYQIGRQFIVTIQPADTTDPALRSRGFGPWYGFKLQRNARNEERVNIHIHGYLSYHDMVAKTPHVRHTIFLKWHRQPGNQDSCTVWINPEPTIQALELSDPPRPKVPPPPLME